MKAIILAGGKGERLYPLTADTPKPMMRISGHPIMEYILATLEKYGFQEVVVATGYLSEKIEKCFGGVYGAVKIKYHQDNEPLGTAGAVRSIAGKWKEPFLVISGDAVFDFDLNIIKRKHYDTGAAVTIASYTADDPREYGILVTDKEQKVVSFLEKPNWNQAVTDLINTGIYIMNPEVLRFVPAKESFDFSKDLFPALLNNGYGIYAHRMEGYWCDIGNVNAYHQCQRDMLDGKIKVPSVITPSDDLPKGNYRIVPPCYISPSAKIGEHSVLGPYTIVDDDCKIEAECRLEDTIVGCRTIIGNNVSSDNAVIGTDCVINNGADLRHHCVLGNGALIGKNAEIKANAVIKPKSVTDELKTNNKQSTATYYLFESNAPWYLARYAYSLGNTTQGRRIALCYESSPFSTPMIYAAKAGLSASDCTVLEFPDCFRTETMFLTVKYGTGVGLHIDSSGVFSVVSQGGLPLDYVTKKTISHRCNGEYHYTIDTEKRMFLHNDGNEAYIGYAVGLMNGNTGNHIKIESDNRWITDAAKQIFGDRTLYVNPDIVFKIQNGGLSLAAVDELGREIAYESLLSLCCDYLISLSENVAVPYAAPVVLNGVYGNGARVLRYLSESNGKVDAAARRLAARQLFVRDGLLTAAFVTGIVHRAGKPLCDLIEPFLKIRFQAKRFQLGINPTKISSALNVSPVWHDVYEGVSVCGSRASAVVIPDETGEWATVFATADKMEAAAEIAVDIEKKIGKNATKFLS